MSHLKLVETRSVVDATDPGVQQQLYTGRRYYIDDDIDRPLPRGVIGDYRISARRSEIHTPVFDRQGRAMIRFWDSDLAPSILSPWAPTDRNHRPLPLDSGLKSNTLLLSGSELEGPALDQEQRLWMAANFDLNFSTLCDAAQLGVLTLVESQRFLDLEGGERVPLLDTGAQAGEPPVLYIDPQAPALVSPVEAVQPRGESRDYRLSTRVSQPVIRSWQGRAVASVTVLEQYFSYFMQQPDNADGEPQCWLPLHPPVAWGWSIRLGRRVDGEWDILRRKVIRPTIGHEGVHLPVWENNTIALTGSEPAGERRQSC